MRDVIFADDGSVTVVYRVTIRGSDGEVGFYPNAAFCAQPLPIPVTRINVSPIVLVVCEPLYQFCVYII